MEIRELELPGTFLIKPRVFEDGRGHFFESFNQDQFKQQGLDLSFVQDNQSLSHRGVLRGLHFQNPPFAQGKLIRVIKGKVLDVAVDIREDSKTFGDYISVVLSADNKKQLFVPRGFAHGFVVLSEEAIFSYKCDNYYYKNAEAGIIYNDSDLNIDWALTKEELLVSEKDIELPNFKSAIMP